MARRDLSDYEYRQALKRRGFKIPPYPMFGYVDIGDGYHVSTDNAPHQTRRGRLAYLIAERKRRDQRCEASE